MILKIMNKRLLFQFKQLVKLHESYFKLNLENDTNRQLFLCAFSIYYKEIYLKRKKFGLKL